MRTLPNNYRAGLALILLGLATLGYSIDTAKVAKYPFKDAQSGKQVTLSSLKGKYKAIYVDLFASWCGPCQQAIPEVVKMNNALKNKGVAFIGVAIGDDWKPMLQDVKKTGINYRVFFDQAKEQHRESGFETVVQQQSIPAVLILDGKTLKPKGTWAGYDPSGHYKAEQLKALKSLGVKTG